MNSFPDDYIVHNLPLVVLCGLEPGENNDSIASDKTRTYLGEGGFRIRADIPPVHGDTAEELRDRILSYDSAGAPWHSKQPGKQGPAYAFKIRSVGRVGQAPFISSVVRTEGRLLTLADVYSATQESTSATSFTQIEASER